MSNDLVSWRVVLSVILATGLMRWAHLIDERLWPPAPQLPQVVVVCPNGDVAQRHTIGGRVEFWCRP